MNITSDTFRMVLSELNKAVETLAAEPRFAKRQLKLESFGKLLERFLAAPGEAVQLVKEQLIVLTLMVTLLLALRRSATAFSYRTKPLWEANGAAPTSKALLPLAAALTVVALLLKAGVGVEQGGARSHSGVFRRALRSAPCMAWVCARCS